MEQPKLENSDHKGWSEKIIVLGIGVPAYSRKYGCLTHCVAGVGEKGNWLRLYPFFAEQVISGIQQVKKFDVIRVVYRDTRPEAIRPESRKIYPEDVEKVNHISDEKNRLDILNKYTEKGNFLHDNSWKGNKTLGMIQPISYSFFITRGVPKVRFRCSDRCSGHTCDLGELKNFDSVGRPVFQKTADLEHKLNLFKNKQLRFVMGTDSRHPKCWLLISIHVIKEELIKKNRRSIVRK